MTDLLSKPLPCIHQYLEYWADKHPNWIAVIQHEEGRVLTYGELDKLAGLYALRLITMGFSKGDRIASMCLKSIPSLVLQYACFKLGVIICPIDIKLKAAEAIRNINQITPKMLFLYNNELLEETNALVVDIAQQCPSIERVIQLQISSEDARISNAESGAAIFAEAALGGLENESELCLKREIMTASIEPADAALIIFTAGTTLGIQKPALLHHECVVAQLMITSLTRAQTAQDLKMMCCLPDSHVGGTTIGPYSACFSGATAILTHRFSPGVVLEAIEKWQATWLGMVPTMYHLLWNQPDYQSRNLKSLNCVYYAGTTVSENFLDRLAAMAPIFGTSLGMTETAGFATVTPQAITPAELVGQVGKATEVAQITIRAEMSKEGAAGEELPLGEVGEICYHPPLVFSGYFGRPQETAQVVSKEGILYSGDIGYFKELGGYKALYIKGRRKFMIKQKGYSVSPDEVAGFIAKMRGVSQVCIVGHPHTYFGEGVFAFIKPEFKAKITREDVFEYCKGIAAYERPLHVELLAENEALPVNNVGKVDIVALSQRAQRIVEQLRQDGQWDAQM